jgi:hypothetical protein
MCRQDLSAAMDSSEQRRDTYRALCAQESCIPLFSRAFWLDAVCGPAGWDVVLAGTTRVEAALPYRLRKLAALRWISMPPLTQTAGPWLRQTSQTGARRLARDKDLMTELIERLEMQSEFSAFSQSFHHSITNWLPFYWRGYAASVRYTYLIEHTADLDACWRNVQSNIRTDLRKATSRHELQVVSENDVSVLLPLLAATFTRQALAQPFDLALLRRIDEACAARSCRSLLVARDPRGRAHAAVYLTWDDSTIYYLIAGADTALRGSGAQSLLCWEGVRLASSMGRSFDFEGSMLEPVERFVRAFGGRQVPYFAVSKSNSVLWEARECARRLIATARRRRGAK